MSHSQTTMKDLHGRMKMLSKTELILDVREPDEFAEGHIPGARNIPHEKVASYAAELKQFERVYIHCRSGKRAQLAWRALEKQGLTNLVCISDGGMLDWVSAGFETAQGA